MVITFAPSLRLVHEGMQDELEMLSLCREQNSPVLESNLI